MLPDRSRRRRTSGERVVKRMLSSSWAKAGEARRMLRSRKKQQNRFLFFTETS
jgi:hypothetical protein